MLGRRSAILRGSHSPHADRGPIPQSAFEIPAIRFGKVSRDIDWIDRMFHRKGVVDFTLAVTSHEEQPPPTCSLGAKNPITRFRGGGQHAVGVLTKLAPYRFVEFSKIG